MKWTKEHDECLVALCDRTMRGYAEVATLTGHTCGSVMQRASQLGLRGQSRKSTFDYSFFHNIDTEEKAYWLGFIYADGSVSANRLTVCLVVEGKKHLEKLAAATRHTGGVTGPHLMRWSYKGESRSSEYYKLAMGERSFIQDLNKHGVVQAKTYCVLYPEIPHHLQRHFIRGIFDGDGCITQGTTKYKDKVHVTPSMNMVGAVPGFLEKIVSIFSDEVGVKKVKVVRRGKTGSTWAFSYQGAPALRIRDWLYTDATVFMECKKERFFSFEYPSSRPRDHRHQEEMIDAEMKKRGWRRLSHYEGWSKKMTIQCDKGHTWSTKVQHFKNGCGCPRCSHSWSRKESA